MRCSAKTAEFCHVWSGRRTTGSSTVFVSGSAAAGHRIATDNGRSSVSRVEGVYIRKITET